MIKLDIKCSLAGPKIFVVHGSIGNSSLGI